MLPDFKQCAQIFTEVGIIFQHKICPKKL